MLRTLLHLRDFLTQEALKFLPGNILSGQFILLKDNKVGKDGFERKLHVFDQTGTFIGTIEKPDWIPDTK